MISESSKIENEFKKRLECEEGAGKILFADETIFGSNGMYAPKIVDCDVTTIQ